MSIQRRNDTVHTRAISAFWRWWSAEGARLLSAAVTTGDYRDLPDTLDAMVKAIGPGLGWETGPGIRARHQFCLSGAGDPGLRVLAERWRRAAPPPTPMWEFAGARQRQPGMLAVTLEAA
ncbi:hypothetical protein, partial [Arthrobacter sp. ISL-65]|uniref:hypothetical protein n=1 Tax=Arthrobacter sp. ISL-65 TaxID=2819112 RepID=UPI001BE53E7F